MVAYMFFAEETPLKEPVTGVIHIYENVSERGPRDKQGRSLRDFDLKTRIFKYPLSYMIYSEAFDGMPAWVAPAVYQQLYDVLTNKNSSPRGSNVSQRLTGANILEIFGKLKPVCRITED